MKSIYMEAKQQLSNCMLDDSNASGQPSPASSGFFNNNHNHNHNNSNNTNNNFITAVTSTSTYDTLERPFKHDPRRGRWSAPIDFYFANTSHAFGTIVFSELPVYALLYGGVYFLPAYIISIILYAIPIFVIQTFLGQFSHSSTISAFRVSPIFKGIGYSILLLNLTSLTYYGIIAAVPFIYAANSLIHVIPWMSCDNTWNTPNCSTHSTYDETEEILNPHATVEFFRYIIRSADDSNSAWTISWPILIAVLSIWFTALVISLQKVSFIGKFFRYTCIIMMTTFVAIFVHLIMYTEISWSTFLGYFEPIFGYSHSTVWFGMRAAITMATWVLGPGWGSVLALASHNRFRCDSEKLTYWVNISHMIIAVMAMISGRIALDHFEDKVGMFHYHVDEDHYMQFLYLCFAYLFGSFTSLPNLWCFLFFMTLFLAELCAIIIQMMSVLTSVFDEYEQSRTKKSRIKIALAVIMAIASVYFCTKQGFAHQHILPYLAIFTHVIISMVLIFVTTWIYGRKRFQCDLQFMLGKTISNFKIFLIRFLTPAFLVISIFQIIFFLTNDMSPTMDIILVHSIVYVVAPAYMIFKICQTNGSLRKRVRQCFLPHDWHPSDSENRRFYDEVMGTSEMLVIADNEQHVDYNGDS